MSAALCELGARAVAVVDRPVEHLVIVPIDERLEAGPGLPREFLALVDRQLRPNRDDSRPSLQSSKPDVLGAQDVRELAVRQLARPARVPERVERALVRPRHVRRARRYLNLSRRLRP